MYIQFTNTRDVYTLYIWGVLFSSECMYNIFECTCYVYTLHICQCYLGRFSWLANLSRNIVTSYDVKSQSSRWIETLVTHVKSVTEAENTRDWGSLGDCLCALCAGIWTTCARRTDVASWTCRGATSAKPAASRSAFRSTWSVTVRSVPGCDWQDSENLIIDSC